MVQKYDASRRCRVTLSIAVYPAYARNPTGFTQFLSAGFYTLSTLLAGCIR
jgi:hypothetical protein